jgi:3-deoxy-D-manno-octulosonic-acid transferase
MEPLAAGLPVLVGPYHTNNREAQQFQHIATDLLPSLVRCTHDSQEFQKILTETLQALESNTKIQETIKNEVNKKSGATRHVLSWIESQLNKDNQ